MMMVGVRMMHLVERWLTMAEGEVVVVEEDFVLLVVDEVVWCWWW